MNRSSNPEDDYRVRVSLRFLVLTSLSSVLLAYAIGWTACLLLVVNPQLALLQQVLELSNDHDEDRSMVTHTMKLPTPVLPAGKILPQTTYTSKAFDTARTTINSRWVVTEEGKKQCVDLPDHECPAAEVLGQVTANQSESKDGEDTELHMPQGQHLLIDIENVDSTFLNSEEQLANAMLNMVNQCGLTLLSYHCHGLTPSGVSCAGVLLESHVSFHTWPIEGVITLDLFTCGDESLLPIVPLAEKLFGVPRGGSDEKPSMVWAHKYRGFSDSHDDDKAELTDFFNFPVGIMAEYKEQICSEQTMFQRVDVVDVLLAHQTKEDYQRSLSGDESYQALHPEYFRPDRIVFLDGVLQSRRSGDGAYHEALVHPGMFVHPNPKRVAIIGGGEGATLREVLKHNTVEKLVMIEIDEMMVSLSRRYLPEWSDCSMMAGMNGSCFDDPRVEVYYEDAFAWFIDRYGADSEEKEEPFDVIIMDALDPQIQKAFVDALYDGGPFLGSLPAAIAENGLLIAQVGEASQLKSPPENVGLNKNRVAFIRTLSDLGFVVVRDYEESHSGFDSPWQMIVAAKSFETMGRWVSDPPLVDYEIRKRAIPTKGGHSPLLSFDAATMISYAYPTKASKKVFCRQYSDLLNCKRGHGFSLEKENASVDVLSRKSSDGKWGIFASKNITGSSYIGLEKAVHGVYIKRATLNVLRKLESLEIAAAIRNVMAYITSYGHKQRRSDLSELIAQTSLHAFINESCGDNVNMGLNTAEEEENIIYNPMRDRQIHVFHAASPNSDIAAGVELLYRNSDEC